MLFAVMQVPLAVHLQAAITTVCQEHHSFSSSQFSSVFPALSHSVFLEMKELSVCQFTCAVSDLGQEGILGVSLSIIIPFPEKETSSLKFMCVLCLCA